MIKNIKLEFPIILTRQKKSLISKTKDTLQKNGNVPANQLQTETFAATFDIPFCNAKYIRAYELL